MRKSALLIAAILALNGCSHITVLRTKEIKAESSLLRARLDSLQAILLDKQRTVDELLRLIRADQQVHFEELEKKISDLETTLSESQYRLSKIDEKTADFQKKLDAKMQADSVAGQSKIAEIKKLFQIAGGDFAAGRFDIALSGFQDLAARFPDSPEGQEMQYWMGECHYAKKSYDNAEKSYLLYIKQNPQGAKVCPALYKLGFCYEMLDKGKSKTVVWKKLLEQCPDSHEAKLVKDQAK